MCYDVYFLINNGSNSGGRAPFSWGEAKMPPISLQNPWMTVFTTVTQSSYYESVSMVFFIISNNSSSPVPFVNNFLGYYLAKFATLDSKASYCSTCKSDGIEKLPITFVTRTVQIWGQSIRILGVIADLLTLSNLLWARVPHGRYSHSSDLKHQGCTDCCIYN